MTVGGLAMHWGGVAPRYSPEDFRLRSLYGVGDDWPFTYDDLDPFYQEAEERMGVAGEQGPPALDPRGKPYPLPPLPINYNLAQLQQWATQAGITTWSTPSAKNSVARDGRAQCQRCDTCYPVCPTGAKYSPDWTWDALVRAKKVTLLTETLVRRLVADREERSYRARHRQSHRRARRRSDDRGEDLRAGGGLRVVAAPAAAVARRGPSRTASPIAAGSWGSTSPAIATSTRTCACPWSSIPASTCSIRCVSKQFMRTAKSSRYLRHDLRVWESSVGREPRLRDDTGTLLLGDDLLADWRSRAKGATARVRAYYDVLPDRESKLVLDDTHRNRFGDPMPSVGFRDAPESAAIKDWQEEQLRELFRRMAKAGGGEILRMENSANDLGQEHPAGGCRMGDDPASSVVDGWGRAHDHDNLWVAGAPAQVSASLLQRHADLRRRRPPHRVRHRPRIAHDEYPARLPHSPAVRSLIRCPPAVRRASSCRC